MKTDERTASQLTRLGQQNQTKNTRKEKREKTIKQNNSSRATKKKRERSKRQLDAKNKKEREREKTQGSSNIRGRGTNDDDDDYNVVCVSCGGCVTCQSIARERIQENQQHSKNERSWRLGVPCCVFFYTRRHVPLNAGQCHMYRIYIKFILSLYYKVCSRSK